MKKIVAVLAVVGAAILPAAAFASSLGVDQSSVVSGSEGSVIVTFSNNAPLDNIIALYDPSGNFVAITANNPNTLSPMTWSALGFPTGLSAGVYNLVDTNGQPTCGAATTYSGCEAGMNYGGFAAETTITITSAGASSTANVWHVPMALPGAMSDNASDQLGDAGTLLLLGIVGGVYLLFWVMKEIVHIVPKKGDGGRARIKALDQSMIDSFGEDPSKY